MLWYELEDDRGEAFASWVISVEEAARGLYATLILCLEVALKAFMPSFSSDCGKERQ